MKREGPLRFLKKKIALSCAENRAEMSATMISAFMIAAGNIAHAMLKLPCLPLSRSDSDI
jgi:hypothetical protein